MKDLLRHLFAFLLNPLERGTEAYIYKSMHRIALLIMSVVFLGLSGGVLWVSLGQASLSYLVTALIFGVVGLLGVVVGGLGNERAVSKLWGNK